MLKKGKIAVGGWKESSDKELIPFVKTYVESGVKKVITTDICKDGMLNGPSIDLYKKMMSVIPEIYLIASGGVASIEDIEKLELAGVPAVIFGKALYEGRITLKELLRFL